MCKVCEGLATRTENPEPKDVEAAREIEGAAMELFTACVKMQRVAKKHTGNIEKVAAAVAGDKFVVTVDGAPVAGSELLSALLGAGDYIRGYAKISMMSALLDASKRN